MRQFVPLYLLTPIFLIFVQSFFLPDSQRWSVSFIELAIHVCMMLFMLFWFSPHWYNQAGRQSIQLAEDVSNKVSPLKQSKTGSHVVVRRDFEYRQILPCIAASWTPPATQQAPRRPLMQEIREFFHWREQQRGTVEPRANEA